MKIFNKKEKAFTAGFTVIEVMIAMAIFTILVTVGTGAALDATKQHARNENYRAILDNLNFVMEDMSRNIRLASVVECNGIDTPPNFSNSELVPADCFQVFTGFSLHMVGIGGIHISYYITDQGAVSGHMYIKKVVDRPPYGAPQEEVITPQNLDLDPALTGFLVSGALPSTATPKDGNSKFATQTTVELRGLDN